MHGNFIIRFKSTAFILFVAIAIVILPQQQAGAWYQGHLDGQASRISMNKWVINLNVGSDVKPELLPIHVELDLQNSDSGEQIKPVIINGSERIPVGGNYDRAAGKVVIEMPHYASSIEFDVGEAPVLQNGVWNKVRGEGKVFKVPCMAERYEEVHWEDPSDFVGRWSVKFKDEDDLAVGVFEKTENSNQVTGTFLTTTGDYRYLAGGVQDGRLQLSCFDGAHAFLFNIDQSESGLSGTFHSGNWYRTSWTGTKDENAALPDAFGQTVWTDKVKLADLKFPNLDGEVVSLADEQFAGKCRIIEVFGSWCPNCHDAGIYLSELQEKYGDDGLSIVGLAFELTGDFDTDATQVRTFVDRIGTSYPMLVAGTSDKAKATKQLQVLDRVRSYPTMIFIDSTDNVKAIYTGFSGPATGEAHEKLKAQFEKIIEEMLAE